MARRSRVVTLQELPEAEEERVELDPEAQRAADLAELDEMEEGEVSRVIDEIKASGAVRLLIMRTLPDIPGKKGYCGEMSPGEFTYEAVRKRYGAGRYRIRCMGPKGLVPGGGSIDVADAPPEAAANQGGNLQDILSVMREEREQERQRERADKEAREERFLKWATVLAPIMTPALAGLFGGKREGVNELVTALASMKQLQGDGESKFDQFVKMLEVAKSMQGEGGSGETNWLDILKEGLGMAKPAITQVVEKVASGQLSLPGPAMPPSPQPSFAAPVAELPSSSSSSHSIAEPLPSPPTTQGTENMLELLPWLKHTAHYLTFRAAKNADPEMYAEWLLDNLPEGTKPETLNDFIHREDWWKLLNQVCPETRPYAGWFTQFRAAVIEMMTPEERPNQGMDQPHHGHDSSSDESETD